jgi:hypothetical protein
MGKESKALLKSIITCLFIGLIMSACVTANFNQKSYQILKTSQSAYDLATDSIIDIHKKGMISDKAYAEIKEKANAYAEAQNMAVDAIKAYQLGAMTVKQTNDKLTAVSVALTELLRLAQPYILKLDGGK